MMCQIIEQLSMTYPVIRLCPVLDVAKSRYYYWRSHQQPKPAQIHLQTQVNVIAREVGHTYGSRRMARALCDRGFRVGRYRARRLMQAAKVVAITPKRRHRYPDGLASVVVPNVLNRSFAANEPNQVWVGDITYLRTTAGWMYLAVVLDLYARKVVGWALSRTADTELTLAALNQALILRRIEPHSNLLFHSDQGCQYTSTAFQQRLKTMGITPSMSRRGNGWDNAVMERFFRSFKTETQQNDTLKTPDEITLIAKKYILFYNTQRIHSTNGYQAPNSFEHAAQKCA